ncbi:hypothetical protein Belba_2502 [Belliella baltica DSM 15883]|uniref:Uncharacterized protein n=1 Tax=Belliella baltica (strain DSM 15883 / CIP 108006 / LMG 21964 / BA134) TaxID=866536 RepID=I3Z738_BELBD|nr:hypothetical protein [Belliella baltica]AFL85056.1 hypothetical protein Belba_2502 [Belliella baltica DSM 15883]
MSDKEITVEDLNKLQKKASDNAIKLNKAMGMTYLVVRNNKLIQIEPDGKETIIGKPEFGTKRIEKKQITLKPSA